MNNAGKFHINSNGDVKVCKATVNRCQFGDNSLHFEDAAEARALVEEIYSKEYGAEILRGKKSSLQELLNKEVIISLPDLPPESLIPMPAKEPSKTKASSKTVKTKHKTRLFSDEDIKWKKRFLRKPIATEVRIQDDYYPVLHDTKKSGFICNNCGKQLNKEEENAILSYDGSQHKCSCGARFKDPEFQAIGVFADQLWMLDKTEYKHRKLYHSTAITHWSEKIKKTQMLRIHLGSKRAAEDRRVFHDPFHRDNDYRIYSITLDQESDVSIRTSSDLNDSWEKVKNEDDFVIYPNRWEHPGSLSIMTIQKYLKIDSDGQRM